MALNRTCQTLLACTLALTASSVEGTQHLVAPGDNWQQLAPRLRAGDEIILMPGRHRPATFNMLHGERGKPITIRGLARDNPSVIVAARHGISLHRPQHVILENFVVTGATIAGIAVDDAEGPLMTERPAGEPWPAHLVIRHVSVTKTGPRGKRHAIQLTGLRDIRIEDVHVEGWGGSGIELVGCHSVRIERCRFIGLSDHSQSHAIQVRGGSQYVSISRCRFENAGDHVVSIGGGSAIDEFRPPVPDDAAPGSQFEVRSVRVQRCTFIGGNCPVALSSCDDCLVRNNTIVRPRRWVLCILNSQGDPRFAPVARGVFGTNLIVWEPGDLERLVFVAEGAQSDRFVMRQNLWWSTEPQQQRDELGTLPGKTQLPQITTIDPKLDEQLKPTEPQAQPFGPDAP